MKIKTLDDTNKISKSLSVLSGAARKELNAELDNIIDLYESDDIAKRTLFYAAAQELFVDLGKKYGTAAQKIAFDALDAQGISLSSVQDIYQVMNSGGIINEAMKKQGSGIGYLNNAMDNVVKRGYRDTIISNAPIFARVPSGSYTCPWCVMLASRGFVYRSETRAGNMNKFHAYCDCAVVPMRNADRSYIDGYDPDHLYELYRQGKSIGEKPPRGKPAFDAEGKPIVPNG